MCVFSLGCFILDASRIKRMSDSDETENAPTSTCTGE